MYQYMREPEISQAALKTALRNLRYSPTPTRSRNPLEHLLLVELIIRSPGIPLSECNRTYALQHVLIDLITAAYTEQRRRLSLPIPDPKATKATVHDYINVDLNGFQVELIAWSWLYHLYGRYDLELNAADFWQQGAFEERTRRRYQNHALGRLTEQLHNHEWEARKYYRKRHLHLKLPTMSQPVIGRDDILGDLQQSVDTIFPVIYQVSGEEGIGKTTLIRELLRRQIKTETLDDLFWFSQPESVEYIQQELLAGFEVTSLEAANSIAADYRIALILDGIETLESDRAGLNNLLYRLPHLMIYMTHRHQIFLPAPVHHVALKGLKPADAQKLMHYLKMTHRGYDFIPDEVEMILESSKGNPGRMKVELQNLVELEKVFCGRHAGSSHTECISNNSCSRNG